MKQRRLVVFLMTILAAVGALWGAIFAAGLKPQLGLDLQGGISAVLIPTKGQGKIDQEVLDQTVQNIRQRVDAIGVAEPDITRQGDTIQVQLPGVADQQQARDVIGRTAQLQFRPVLAVYPPDAKAPEAGTTCDQRNDPPNSAPDQEVVLCLRPDEGAAGQPEAALPRSQWDRLRLGPARVVGNDVATAIARPQQSGLGWEVSLGLKPEGAKKFEEVTAQLACQPVGSPTRQIAIVLDNLVESAPPVASDVPCNVGIRGGGGAVITVGGGSQEAKELASIIRAGALPIRLEFGTFQTVSPTLGRNSLQAGLLAGVIGLAFVAAYLVFLYRGIGLAAVSELVIFGLIVFGTVIVLGRTTGFTLTLAGIAGIIVAIGIAADSSIIYRERFRDELRGGRTIRTAADAAFKVAFRTNLTGNTVSFLAAAVLYLLAVGPVRGFAFTLGLATLVDTLVFATYTRAAFGLIARSPRLASSPLMGLRTGIAPATQGAGARSSSQQGTEGKSPTKQGAGGSPSTKQEA
jgi:preprotein translocase subunit SecD